MNSLTIGQLVEQGIIHLVRGEVMKSDSTLADRAPVLRPSDVVHNRTPERLSDEYDEPIATEFPTARIGDIAIALHFSPGSSCLITEDFDGSVPTKGIVLCSISFDNNVVDSEYLTTWLLSGVLKKEMQRFQSGGHMATVKMSDLEQVRVPIPDAATQKKLYKAVVDVRESSIIISQLAHETNRLLALQYDLFNANISELNNA